MKRTIRFSYDIGDKVTLVKVPSFENMQLGKYIKDIDFEPKDYVVSGLKCVFLEGGEEKILYRLDAYCDEYIRYHNWLTEDYIEGNGTSHEEDFTFLSVKGGDLSIGDLVYDSLYYGASTKSYIEPECTFTRLLRVDALEVEKLESRSSRWDLYASTTVMEDFQNPNNNGTKSINRSFVCILLREDETKLIVEDYIKACKKKRFNIKKQPAESSAVKTLKKIGVYQEVLANYNKVKLTFDKDTTIQTAAIKKPAKKKKTKVDLSDTKAEDILNNMSQEQRQEMLALLMKQ